LTYSQVIPQIALVCIDEVHLLNEARGSALEAGVVSRIKMVSSFREMQEVCLCVALTHSIQIAEGHYAYLQLPE